MPTNLNSAEPDNPSTDSVLATLHVCTSCRPKGMRLEPVENRPGYQLHEALVRAVAVSPMRESVRVQPVQCMSLCPRPCAIAFSAPGRWSYLFGDQFAASAIHDVLTCLRSYLDETDGALARNQRPESLQASILGRIPPIDPSIVANDVLPLDSSRP